MRTQIALIPGQNNDPDVPGYGEIKGNPVFRIRVTPGERRDSVGETGDPARGLTGENLRADGWKTPGWSPPEITKDGVGKNPVHPVRPRVREKMGKRRCQKNQEAPGSATRPMKRIDPDSLSWIKKMNG